MPHDLQSLSVPPNELRCIFALALLRVLVTLFPCWLSIRLFCNVLFVFIFVLFSYNPVVGISSCILPLLAGRIFFVGFECPVLGVLFYLVNWITITRKSGKHLRMTETVDSCFDLIRSHQQCIPWSPPLEIEPATKDTVPKLYNWAISSYRTQVTPN